MGTHIQIVLLDIVGNKQTGFMESRQIQTNIRQAIDIVAHIYQSGKKLWKLFLQNRTSIHFSIHQSSSQITLAYFLCTLKAALMQHCKPSCVLKETLHSNSPMRRPLFTELAL